ncbi:MAG: hypothetical protein ABIJ57_09335 [Pseudomonadota bacterium]
MAELVKGVISGTEDHAFFKMDPSGKALCVTALDDRYFARKKFFYYADGSIKYLCGNTSSTAAETDDDWECSKYVWTAGQVTEWQGWLNGAVDLEATVNALAWTI